LSNFGLHTLVVSELPTIHKLAAMVRSCALFFTWSPQQAICSPASGFAMGLESEPGVHLKLTPSACGVENSADILGELTCCIFEDGVAVPSQSERTLRIAWHGKIRMIEQIVSFNTQCNLLAFTQFEALLQCQIKLCEAGSAKNVPSSSAKSTRRW
jgi:hypothetical protein